ncbi:MAG: hypothetical protein Q7W55_07120 [Pseudohongiella sp.]|nr:hypothetical protein [Pseudohongiella sp.]
MNKIYQSTANSLYPDSPETYRLKKTYFNVLSYIHENDWQGACHATTAILYVLLREQGLEAVPCLGEVSQGPIVFDHSWIEIDSKVLDAAVSKSLIQGISFPPVFLDSNLLTGDRSDLIYGSDIGRGLDAQAQAIADMPIGLYMDGFPGHPEGLWGIAKLLGKRQGLKLSLVLAKSKWGKSNWVVRS